MRLSRLPLASYSKAHVDRLKIEGYAPQAYSGSNACLALSKFWLSNCRENHKVCDEKAYRKRPSWTPTRLIDVSGPHPRLRTDAKIARPAEYLALSHCWGQVATKVVLTTGNVAEFRKRLPDTRHLRNV